MKQAAIIRVLPLAFAGLALAGAPRIGFAQAIASPRATAHAPSDSLRIDGRLDEASWTSAPAIGPLTQSDPGEGQPASEVTDVRVLVDEGAVYFGVFCRDRQPAAIVSTQLTRDADLDVDDHITIVLDPFLDHRNGFFFQLNAAGARSDGQVSNNSEDLDRDWDGIWEAAARVTEQGWEAEIRIPFKTLRFKSGQPIWGFNVERQIKRRQELDRWSAPRRNVWIGNLAQAGELEGLAGARQGRGLDIRPYLSARNQDDAGPATAGVDVFQNITPNLNASVTVNTDFAETEADIRQVNLTRFPLFFPEKRAFFLKGSGVFDIAGLQTSTDIRPFFSRRIGLLDNLTVPVLAGAKVIGRQSDYNIGFLDVETRSLRDPDLPNGVVNRQNLLALRVSRNLFQQSWVGAIFTRGNPSGTGSNTLAGVDARFATSTFLGDQNISFDVFALRTQDEASDRGGTAAGFRVDYPNDLWDVFFNFKQIDSGFEPALGFVPRKGIRKTNMGVSFQPRPERWGIRQWSFGVEPRYITNLDNRVENWEVTATPVDLRTESGEQIEWSVGRLFEHLDAPFEIEDGVVIPAGSYEWTRQALEVSTASKRRWVLEGALSYGTFYDGHLLQWGTGVTLKASTHVALSVNLERDEVDLPQGRFATQVLRVRGDYNFSPNVSWANLLQYDNDSRIFGAQSRFRWIVRPGNDIFLVLNRGWFRELDGRYTPEFNRESVKAQYTFRF